MRTAPAVLIALLVAAPGLTATVDPATTAAGELVRGAGLPSSSISAPVSAGDSAEPAAGGVATAVHELRLAGVDAQAQAAYDATVRKAAESAGRGAPGAGATLATHRPAVLTKATGTQAFQTVGVTWAAVQRQPDLLVSVRTHDSLGPLGADGWSAWTDLDSDGDDDADGADDADRPGTRGGTDPFWVGPSDGVQARVVVRSGALPKDLRVELVDPGTSAYDAVAATSAPGATADAAPATLGTTPGTTLGTTAFHASSVAAPKILSRAQWGADESRVRGTPDLMPTIKAAVLHHTAGKNNYAASAVPAIIRGDYAYHLQRGWNDIGYNALVDRFGRIWEGRAGGITQAVMGAHAGGFNTDTFGVAMIGNYDTAKPTAAAVTAVARVMAWKLDLNHRNPLGTTSLTSAGGGTARWKAGTTRTLPVIMGHRNTGFTACPGRYLYPQLPAIRAKVKAIMKAALMNPSGPPATVAQGRPVTMTARALATQSWQLDVEAPCGGGRVARVTGAVGAGQEITATWNGRIAGGGVARPGRYTLTLTSRAGSTIARAVTGQVLVLPPAPVAEPTGPASTGTGGYVPVTPARLVDTRSGGLIGIGPGGRLDVPVLGRAGVPAAGVSAVVLNLTTNCPSDPTSLSVWPTGTRSNRPVTSVPAGLTRSVLVTTRVGAGGAVSIGNAQGVTELTADVVGYYTDTAATGGEVRTVPSTRIYSSSGDPAGKLATGKPRRVALPATVDGVPAAQVSAVMVDVSALSPAGAGTLTAYRTGDAGDLPTLTYRSGESIDNLAVVPVTGGAFTLAATGTPVDVIVDLRALVLTPGATGIQGKASFTATRPVLVYDTRATGGAVVTGKPRKVVVTGKGTGVPADATGVLASVVASGPSATTSLQLYPWGEASTGGAALRLAKGDTRGNLVVLPVGAGGAVAVANAQGRAQLRVDVRGYLR